MTSGATETSNRRQGDQGSYSTLSTVYWTKSLSFSHCLSSSTGQSQVTVRPGSDLPPPLWNTGLPWLRLDWNKTQVARLLPVHPDSWKLYEANQTGPCACQRTFSCNMHQTVRKQYEVANVSQPYVTIIWALSSILMSSVPTSCYCDNGFVASEAMCLQENVIGAKSCILNGKCILTGWDCRALWNILFFSQILSSVLIFRNPRFHFSGFHFNRLVLVIKKHI